MDLHSQKIQEKKNDLHNQPQTINKMTIGQYITIITLNVNGLNAPTKRHRLAEWTQKPDPYICCLQEAHLIPQETNRHANGKQKKAGVAIILSDKIDLKIKKITGDKERCCIIIKGSVQGEDVTTVNIYASNIGAPQYIRKD